MIATVKYLLIGLLGTITVIVVFPICMINWEWGIYRMIAKGMDEATQYWVFNNKKP